MTESNLFNAAIINKLKSIQKAEIVQPVHVGDTDKQNEMVFFIKPELLDVDADAKVLNSLSLIKTKFEEYDVVLDGAAIIPGAVLEEFEIMNRHYGFINQLSRMASSIIDPETRQRMFEHLGIKDQDKYQILGGHEFLSVFDADVDRLSNIWFAQESNKLRSGFYFIKDTFQGQPFILVNGFHPSQLLHFTRADHRIILMLLHTDTDWKTMKFDMVGDTFPERAKPGSIRGMLYADPERYGQKEVTINTNGVHLSAGPFEAAFEVVNFFGRLLELELEKTPPLAIKRAMEAGPPLKHALSLLDNPDMNESDLFSDTENMNTGQAVEWIRDRFDGN